jgi:hypothetical protein
MKFENWSIFLKIDEYFVTNEFTRSKKKHDEILRYKTWWMIRDFEQIERLNYTKTFVSIIKSINYKTMYVIIVINDWKIKQINVKIFFLYDKIHEKIYVVQLTNFEQNIN